MDTSLIIKNQTNHIGTVKKELRLAKKNGKVDQQTKQANSSIVLSESDYNYFINWKNEKNQRQSKQHILFLNIGLSLALGLVLLAFEWSFEEKVIVEDLQLNKVAFEEFMDVPPTEQPPPSPPQVTQQPIVIEVPDEEILEEVEINIDVEATQEMVVEEVVYLEEAIPEEVAEEIFLIVEEAPEPIGGTAAFYKYVGNNIKYPTTALRENVSGRVFVQFIVGTSGEIENVKIVKGIGYGCDEEAIRIVKNSPNWKPGKQRGKPVKVQMVLPITFKMSL